MKKRLLMHSLFVTLGLQYGCYSKHEDIDHYILGVWKGDKYGTLGIFTEKYQVGLYKDATGNYHIPLWKRQYKIERDSGVMITYGGGSGLRVRTDWSGNTYLDGTSYWLGIPIDKGGRVYKITDEEAISVAGLTLGGLIWWWILIVIDFINLRDFLPKNSIDILLIGSCLISLYVSSRDRMRSEIITKGNNYSFPVVYHVLAYILFAWTFLGPILIVVIY